MISPELQAKERLRKEKALAAKALFKQHPKFPATWVQIVDAEKQIINSISSAARERLSEPRLEHLIELFDLRSECLLQLVDNIQLQEAFEILVDDLARQAWWELSALPVNGLQPIAPFSTPHPSQIKQDKIFERAHHWTTEGYRRLAEMADQKVESTAAPKRRAYRAEVSAWMGRVGLDKQTQAAKRLGVSLDVLKSIMTDKGRARYSRETLDSVLEKIMPKKDGD
jgi:hypothetical protein